MYAYIISIQGKGYFAGYDEQGNVKFTSEYMMSRAYTEDQFEVAKEIAEGLEGELKKVEVPVMAAETTPSRPAVKAVPLQALTLQARNSLTKTLQGDYTVEELEYNFKRRFPDGILMSEDSTSVTILQPHVYRVQMPPYGEYKLTTRLAYVRYDKSTMQVQGNSIVQSQHETVINP